MADSDYMNAVGLIGGGNVATLLQGGLVPLRWEVVEPLARWLKRALESGELVCDCGLVCTGQCEAASSRVLVEQVESVQFHVEQEQERARRKAGP